MAAEPDVFATPEAGGKVIRGGAVRSAGYLAGMGLSAGAAVLLLRHLGVVDFGHYVTVMALVTIAAGVAEGGLTVIGQRQWTRVEGVEARRRLIGNIVGIRIALTGSAMLVATGFAAVAGYGGTLVLGTAIAGTGLILFVTSTTLALPLSMELRLGALTAVDFAQQLAIFTGIAVLVIIGASLLPFFAVQVFAGVVTVAVAVALAGRATSLRPRFDRAEWRVLLRAIGPVAVAVAVNQVYLRILVVLMSLLSTNHQTGLFATAFRVNDIFVGLPIFMVGAAFPVLAHAGVADEPRLANALQKLAQVALVVALVVVLGTAIAADEIVKILGGAQYEGAGPVLRIQVFALIGASLTQVWSLGLVAIDRQRLLVITNGVALTLAVILGLVLIPARDAMGASIAAVCGELTLALANLTMLVRCRPALRPNPGFLWRAALSAGLGALCALLPIPAIAAGALAAIVFVLAALATHALPREVVVELLRRGAPA
ncbi:MAG: oligosaccharide flippase family protein [Thermoleophilaceae bacterium]